MVIVFCVRLGVLSVWYFRKGTTMTGEAYAKILGPWKWEIQRKRGNKLEDGVSRLHDNTPSHTSKIAKSAVEDLRIYGTHTSSLQSDLAPSIYYLFPKLKEFLRRRTFKNSPSTRKTHRKLQENRQSSIDLNSRAKEVKKSEGDSHWPGPKIELGWNFRRV